MKNSFFPFVKSFLLLLFFFILSGSVFADGLTGIKNIPIDYPTLSDAIIALNANGVGSGGVTFNVAANYIETFSSPTSGLITVTGSAADPIVFQKSGSGSNPAITSGIGSTLTNDAIIAIAGGDYITFNGIDVKDNPANTDATTQMEWGYALVKASSVSPFNGCQYVTIKNCTITLNRTNTATKGIYSGNHIATNVTALTLTATTDAANNNSFYSNTIINSYMGIWVLGYNSPNPYTLFDQNNDIGSLGGNTITDFGGGSATAYGIGTGYNSYVKVNNNTVSSVTSGHTSTLYGIGTTGAGGTGGEVIGNAVTVKSSAASGSCAAIYNTMGSNVAGCSLTIANNNIQNCTYLGTSSSGFMGIVNTAGVYNVNIYGNTIANNSKGTAGSFYCMQSGAANVTNVYNNNIYNNTFGGGTGTFYGYYNVGNSITDNIYNNNIYGLTHSGTGTVYGIYLNTTAGVKTINNNNIHSLSSGGSVVACTLNVGTPANFFKNIIYDLSSSSATGTNGVYGLYSGTASAVPTLNVYNNYIFDLRAPNSTNPNGINGIYLFNGTADNIYFNTIYLNSTNVSAGPFGSSGIYATTTPTIDLRNNIIVNTSTSVGAAYTVAYRRSSTTLTTHSSACNRNDFYAGTPGINNLIFYDGTNSSQTIADYKIRVSPADEYSFTETPPFTTISGNPCRINTATPTLLESRGMSVTPFIVTDDYFNNPRNASTPDVGAEEFAGIGFTLNLNLTAALQGFWNNSQMNPDTVDIELRSSTSPYTLIESQRMPLGTSATGYCNFRSISNGTPYYLVVKHRNSIETWSAAPVIFTDDNLSYDFTTGADKAYGNNLVQKGSKWCIYSGDVNQDGFVNIDDINLIYQDNVTGSYGYVVKDITGDHFVEVGDVSLVFTNKVLGIQKIRP